MIFMSKQKREEGMGTVPDRRPLERERKREEERDLSVWEGLAIKLTDKFFESANSLKHCCSLCK